MAAITSPTGAAHARIVGVGSYRPERVVTNEEICQHIDSSDEWIRERTGIITRRFAAEDETIVDMGAIAAQRALEHAGLTGADVDAVMVASVTHMLATPAAAPMIADRIGATPAPAFDISAACAGFCHGIALAQDMVRSGSATTVVLIGVEKLSAITDPTDRGSAFIFADGAGAVVIRGSDEPGIGPTIWGSDGARAEVITMTHTWDELPGVGKDTFATLRMQGPAVFRWAVFQMAPVALEAITAAGLTPDELDVFIPHQANMRIIDSMLKQLKLPKRVAVARDIAEMGNTSAASIPLAMDRMIQEGTARSGDTALLIGFGAGLAFAGQVVRIP